MQRLLECSERLQVQASKVRRAAAAARGAGGGRRGRDRCAGAELTGRTREKAPRQPRLPPLNHASQLTLSPPATLRPPPQDCVHKTITRIENKLALPRVLAQCTYMLRSADRTVQQRVAIALARHVAPGGELAPIFIDKAGLDVLLGLVTEPPRGGPGGEGMVRDGAAALLHLAGKVNATAPIHAMWVAGGRGRGGGGCGGTACERRVGARGQVLLWTAPPPRARHSNIPSLRTTCHSPFSPTASCPASDPTTNPPPQPHPAQHAVAAAAHGVPRRRVRQQQDAVRRHLHRRRAPLLRPPHRAAGVERRVPRDVRGRVPRGGGGVDRHPQHRVGRRAAGAGGLEGGGGALARGRRAAAARAAAAWLALAPLTHPPTHSPPPPPPP
jgi:hypothetical protein